MRGYFIKNDTEPLCYKLGIDIIPNWNEIFQIQKNDEDKFLKGGNIDPEVLFMGMPREGDFSYIIFHDEFSGLKQIWSNNYKAFVDDTSEQIHFNEGKLRERYGYSLPKGFNKLIITPSQIGYESKYGEWIDEDRVVSEIPTGLILEKLFELYRVWGYSMRGILEFPKDLQEEFDRYGVEYETYNTDDEFLGNPIKGKETKVLKKIGFKLSIDYMRSHIFSTKYFSISISIEHFKDYRRNLRKSL